MNTNNLFADLGSQPSQPQQNKGFGMFGKTNESDPFAQVLESKPTTGGGGFQPSSSGFGSQPMNSAASGWPSDDNINIS